MRAGEQMLSRPFSWPRAEDVVEQVTRREGSAEHGLASPSVAVRRAAFGGHGKRSRKSR